MEDIAPGLLERIRALFLELLGDDKPGADTYTAAGDYAERVGDALATAFQRHLSGDVLPDGKMYWNIADRVVRPLLEEDWRLCTGAAVGVQQALNKAAGIGLAAQVPEPDKDRINGILNKICAADRYEDTAWMLGEPVRMFSRAAVDETLRRNVDFHAKAGLRPRIVRTAEHGCCKWCTEKAGTYDYPDVPDDVYKRHANCRCSVEYDPGDGKRQDVWSKRWTNAREHGILNKERPVRAMANGPRRGALTRVSAEEERQIRKEADDLGIPQSVLSFNTGYCTSFDEVPMRIHIRGDIFPSEYAPNRESILSARCALAHEYYGHYLQHPSRFPSGDWRDEFSASYRAALDTPNLTDGERAMLMMDAFERAHAANVPVRFNCVARKIIYGDGRL